MLETLGNVLPCFPAVESNWVQNRAPITARRRYPPPIVGGTLAWAVWKNELQSFAVVPKAE
jgi:hypothetical protein